MTKDKICKEDLKKVKSDMIFGVLLIVWGVLMLWNCVMIGNEVHTIRSIISSLMNGNIFIAFLISLLGGVASICSGVYYLSR